MIAGAVTATALAVSITLWSVSTFQSKADAAEMKVQLERRIDSMEGRLNAVQVTVSGVAVDVSYIRGRLEPKQ